MTAFEQWQECCRKIGGPALTQEQWDMGLPAKREYTAADGTFTMVSLRTGERTRYVVLNDGSTIARFPR